MFKIENPTNVDVSIVVEGQSYMVPAGGETTLENAGHALYWKKVHGFLIVKEAESKPAPKVVEEVPEVKEEPVKETKRSVTGKSKK